MPSASDPKTCHYCGATWWSGVELVRVWVAELASWGWRCSSITGCERRRYRRRQLRLFGDHSTRRRRQPLDVSERYFEGGDAA